MESDNDDSSEIISRLGNELSMMDKEPNNNGDKWYKNLIYIKTECYQSCIRYMILY